MQADNGDIEELLRNEPGRWERLITADLSQELARIAGDKGVVDIPELRRFLAVKGFRDLKTFLGRCADGKQGEQALHAIIVGMRTFARERPGISAATFRSVFTDCPEWRQAGSELAGLVTSALIQIGIEEEQAEPALCAIRGLVRGYVMHEMQGSFLDVDYDQLFIFAADALVAGLKKRAAQNSQTAH